MEYVFKTTTYDVEALMPELVQALEKREELLEQAREEARAKNPRIKSPEQMAAKKRIFNLVYGLVLLALGVYLVMVAVTERESWVLAALAAVWSFGAAAYAFLRVLRPNPNEGKKKSEDFEKPARSLLTHLAKAEPCEIHFDEKGMTFAGAPAISFKELEYFIETPSAYLVTWSNKAATLLQKKDLTVGSAAAFPDFVITRI